MKDPTTEILTAFYTALNGNLSYGGVNYPVYTVPPKSGGYNYVLLDDVELLDDMAKDYFDSQGTILIDVVTASSSDGGSILACNDITNDLLLLVIKKDLSMSNFKFSVTPYLELMSYLKEQTDTHYIVRKLIRLAWKVTQN